MTLGELAFACFVFARIDSGAYERLLDETGEYVDLSKLDHRLATIRWLSAWGVRAIPRNYHNAPSDMSEQLKSWYESNELFDHGRNLQELRDNDLDSVGDAYKNLVKVRYIGPTAAAKILFAIRPKSLMPWDEPIRKELQYNETSQSYISFLRWAQVRIQEVGELCKKHGFEVIDLPKKLGRPNSTIPKLIDEYLWVTITKQWNPSKADFERWLVWSS
jgi:hypothetical protein